MTTVAMNSVRGLISMLNEIIPNLMGHALGQFSSFVHLFWPMTFTNAPVIERLFEDEEPEYCHKKVKNTKHSGNISFDDVAEMAIVMRSRSMAMDLSVMIKEILRAYVLVGCTVDGKDPKDLQQGITKGGIGLSLLWLS